MDEIQEGDLFAFPLNGSNKYGLIQSESFKYAAL